MCRTASASASATAGSSCERHCTCDLGTHAAHDLVEETRLTLLIEEEEEVVVGVFLYRNAAWAPSILFLWVRTQQQETTS